MKKFYFGLVSAVLFALAACTQDPADGPLNPGVEDDGNSVFFDVALTLPSADSTRSSTDNEDEDKGDSHDPSQDDQKTPSDATTPDYEYGYDYENQVSTLLIVLATADSGDPDTPGAKKGGDYLIHSVVNTVPPTAQTPSLNDTYKVTAAAKFSREKIEALYAQGAPLAGTGPKKVQIYVYCNYTPGILSDFSTIANEAKEGSKYQTNTSLTSTPVWLNWLSSLTEEAGSAPTNSIWGKNLFLMTNAVVVEAQLPTDIENWAPFTSETNPFHLSSDNTDGEQIENSNAGPVKVERAAARLDFKDGSLNPSEGQNGANDANKPATYKLSGNYTVVEGESVKPKDVNLFDVQLKKMSLVNMGVQYFNLRRVSDNGTDTNWRIGKYETTSNYVVDADWSFKQSNPTTSIDNSELYKYFNFPLFDYDESHTHERTVNNTEETVYPYNSDAWYTSKITEVLGGEKDTWTGNNYRIWRYVTENTIPSAAMQKTGYSTGIVFTAQITAGNDASTAVYAQDGDINQKARFVSDDVVSALNETTENSPVLYMFGNLLYTFDELVKQAYEHGAGSSYHNAVQHILSNWYLMYTWTEDVATKEFDPTTATSSTFDFVYSATTPAPAEKTGYLPLTVEIYYALTKAPADEFDTKYKEGVSTPEQKENPDNVWKPENTYLKAFMTNKANFAIDGVNFGGAGTTAIDQTTDGFKDLAVAYFTLYRPTQVDGNWGYYCYYFYWNRHNNNGKNAEMGPMEFATVRNNVYKLSVTKIGRIGHPTVATDDPDPIDPDDDDEEQNLYIDVQVEVLPWVVRVNDIEF